MSSKVTVEKNFKSFVVIRFSIVNDKWRTPYKNREKWFDFRTRIFFLTAYSSIMRNSIVPKKIILLFDVSDKFLYDKYFSRYELDLIHPIFTTKKQMKKNVMNYLINSNKSSGDYLLTRIDSDDIICRNYFAVIFDAISKNKNRNFFVVTKGYRTDFTKTIIFEYKNSPFLSILYNRENLPFIYDFGHQKSLDYQPLFIKETCFIQIVNSSNISNKLPQTSSFFYKILYYYQRFFYPKRNFFGVCLKDYKKSELIKIIDEKTKQDIIKEIEKYKNLKNFNE